MGDQSPVGKTEFREGEAESQSNVLQLILADQHHQGASSSELITHDKVVRALEATREALGQQPGVAISRVEKLVSAVPASPPMLCTLFTAVKHGLCMCVQVEASPTVTPALSSLFKTTYSQLKAGLKTIHSLPSESPLLNPAITALVDVAVAALTFDPSMLALCWKELIGLLCKIKGQSCDLTLIVVKELCLAVKSKFKECESSEGKLFKLATFLGGLLGRAVQETCTTVGVSGVVLPCLLSVLSQVLPLLLQEQALLMMEAVMSTMVHYQDFLKLLLDCPLGDSQALGRLVCLCSLITFLPNLEDGLVEYCVDKVSSAALSRDTCHLLECLFHCLMQTYIQLQLPVRVRGVMTQGRPPRMVTLSEYVTYHLCALCSIVPVHYLCQVERSLFRGVLSPIPVISLVCTDVWVFHARRNSVSALADLCQFFSLLTQEVSCPSLSSLFSRLLSLLPLSSRALMFSPSQLVSFDPCLLQSIPVELVATKLPGSLHCLDSSTLALAVSTVGSEQKALLVDHIVALICDQTDVDDCSLVKLLSRLPLSPGQFNKVLAVSMNRWSEARDTALCTFLHCEASWAGQNCSDIAACFQHLISSDSWLVHQLSLEAFRELAKLSGNTMLLESCVPEGYTELVVEFLHQRPCGDWSVWHVEKALMEQVGYSLGRLNKLIQQWKELCDTQQLSYASRQTLVRLVQNVKCHSNA